MVAGEDARVPIVCCKGTKKATKKAKLFVNLIIISYLSKQIATY